MASARLAALVAVLGVVAVSFSITLTASGAPSAPSFADLAVGHSHACVVTNVGGVKCWGSNKYGQLGNGVSSPCTRSGRCPLKRFSLTPVDVVGLGSRVTAISAGGGHTCALTNVGGVKCWGYNASGQLGNAQKACTQVSTCSRTASSTPVDVVGLTRGVSEVAAGEFHTCAVTSRGAAKCWGSQTSGELGNGTGDSSGVPVDVAGLTSGVSAIAAGAHSSCAITSGGTVKCWGGTPRVIAGLPNGVTAITIGGTSAGATSGHACALVSGGGVKCWGTNWLGTLGNGSLKDSSTPVDAVGLAKGIRAVRASSDRTCALTSQGGAKCWGSGLLGNGSGSTNGKSSTPVDVVGLTSGLKAIAAGGGFACALPIAGGVKCWGMNFLGRLGNGATAKWFPKPVDVRFSGEPSTKPPTSSSGSGRCSKAEATAVVKRLRLSDSSYPVYKVLCGAFSGPGSRTMVASIYGADNVGMTDWAIFRWSGSEWRLILKQHQAAVLIAAGSDIRESVSIYRPGDSRCCPSGGTKSRIWQWNGTRLVAGPWKQIAKREPKDRGFDSPSLNISCGMFDNSSFRQVVCQSRRPPQKVILNAAGRVTICRDPTPNDFNNECGIGDRGENPIRPLAYGRQITVGRFRCESLEIGVRCTVIRSGKGFLINRDGVRRVG